MTAGRVAAPATGGMALLEPLRGERRALDPAVRGEMERVLEASFGDVVVHTGAASGAAADHLDAAAFTVGRHIVFGPGGFDPSTPRGRMLLAHELAHVVQQRRGGGDPDLGEQVPGAALARHTGTSEGHAHLTAARAALGGSARVSGATGVGIARQSKADEKAAASVMGPNPDGQPSVAVRLQPIAGDNLAATQAVMRSIDDLRVTPDGRYTTTYQGTTLFMTPEDASKSRAAAMKALGDVVAKSRRRYDDAVAKYKAQEAVDSEFWLTSKAVHAAAWVANLGDHSDPGMALTLYKSAIDMAELAVQREAGAGHLEKAAEGAARCERISGRSAALVRIYVDQTIEGAEHMVTGLEFTRDAAFVTLGVLAVVATAGAAAGVAPGVIGTGIGGLSLGTTTTVISVGAPIIASVGVGLAKLAEGDPVDWGDIAVDVAVQVVLAKFGGKLGERVFGRLAGNPATRTVMRRALATVGSGVISHEFSQAFTVTVNETYTALRGRPTSWGHFLDELSARLSDPKGIFIAAAMSGFQLAAHGAVDKANAAKGTTAKGSPTESTGQTSTKIGGGDAAPGKVTNANGGGAGTGKTSTKAKPALHVDEAEASTGAGKTAKTPAKAKPAPHVDEAEASTGAGKTAKTPAKAKPAPHVDEAEASTGAGKTAKTPKAGGKAGKASREEKGGAKAPGPTKRLPSLKSIWAKARRDTWKKLAEAELAARSQGLSKEPPEPTVAGKDQTPPTTGGSSAEAQQPAVLDPVSDWDSANPKPWQKFEKPPAAWEPLDPIKELTSAELKKVAETGSMPKRVGAEIEHARIPQRVAKALADTGLPTTEAAALSKLTDPSNLQPTHRESHAWMDSHAKKGGPKYNALDDRATHPLGSATLDELKAIAQALKKPGVKKEAKAFEELAKWLSDEKTRRGASADSLELP